MIVSDYFSPTGSEGDGMLDYAVVVTHDCPTRANDAQGDCYRIAYTPPLTGSYRYAALVWQFPAGNFGNIPPNRRGAHGMRVAPGAKDFTFTARVDGPKLPDKVTVLFDVGVIKGGVTASDTVTSFGGPQAHPTLTQQWQQFTVPITATKYDHVLGAFSVAISLNNATTPSLTNSQGEPVALVVYVDDIRWE